MRKSDLFSLMLGTGAEFGIAVGFATNSFVVGFALGWGVLLTLISINDQVEAIRKP